MEHYNNYSAEELALDKYFQQWVLAPDDQAEEEWNNFVNRHPTALSRLHEARELVRLSGLSLDADDNISYLQGWEQLRSSAPKKNFSILLRAGIAAALVAVVVASVMYFTFFRQTEQFTYKTEFGEIRKIALNDGSTITLNANSTITASGSPSRNIYLEGDAFFEVTHTPENTPFVVFAGDVEVHVIGTSFDVRARDEHVKVYLKSGQIRLKSGAVEKVLSPGDEAAVTKGSTSFTVKRISGKQVDATLSWLENQYIMDDRALTEVASDIRNTFGKQVIFEDPALGQKRVSAKVPSNDLDVLLEVISQALDLKVEEKDGRIYIRANK